MAVRKSPLVAKEKSSPLARRVDPELEALGSDGV